MQVDGRFVEQARRDLTALLAAHPDLEEDDVLRLDMVEGETNVMELLDQLIRAERDARMMQKAIGEELDRLGERLHRMEARKQLIRKYMMQLMEAANLKKAERPAATVSIAAGRPKVVITEEWRLLDEYVRTKTEPDKEAIRKALLEDRVCPGATLSNAEPTLRIS